ncbi:MAG: sensor histidine kinase [Firmicutes bacterium]|nr:sensor histidine kinase [Bacillota bacterium]
MTRNIGLPLDEQWLEHVFQSSVDALRQTRDELYEISEAVRDELERLRHLLEQVQRAVAECIGQVEQLEAQSAAARSRLAEISRDFTRFSDDDIRAAYTEAERLMVALGQAREREQALRQRRDELERQIKQLRQVSGKAERIVTQVAVAVDFLSGNMASLTSQVEDMREKAAMARHIVRAQEEERRRVAREIHDGPAQLLANVMLRVDILERMMPGEREPLLRELQDVKHMVKDTVRELRRLIFNLRPMMLDDLGLVPTLRGFIDSLREDGLDAELHVAGQERRLEPSAEVALFRIVQEAVRNARQHGRCSWAAIRVEYGGQGVSLLIEDNGVGFDPESVPGSDGELRFGLIHMREQVRLLDGDLRITSAPGRGTKVRVSIPWHTAAGPDGDAESRRPGRRRAASRSSGMEGENGGNSRAHRR